MEPCKFNDDIQSLKKTVFVGNGTASLVSQMSTMSTKMTEIHDKVNSWDNKMGELLDFKAGALAVKGDRKERNEMSWTKAAVFISAILGFSGIVGSYFGKTDKNEVKTIVQEVTKAQDDLTIKKEKTASFEKEVNSIIKK